MNTILLQPTDVLFFRDGRPMSGSLAGHTAAWPLPDVTNHALHAALHRAEIEGVHGHRQVSDNGSRPGGAARTFGSLATAGPFPVRRTAQTSTWFFPCPADAQPGLSAAVALHPATTLTPEAGTTWPGSSLPSILKYAVGSTQPPAKRTGGERWLSPEAFTAYIGNPRESFPAGALIEDEEIADREAQIGIAIDPETETTGTGAVAGQIYTAFYLRLREGWRLGLLAEASDKVNGDPSNRRDLIPLLFQGTRRIIVGGQQRVCTSDVHPATGQPLPLPKGLSAGFRQQGGKHFVKWVLLSPAVWPRIIAAPNVNPHPGGWLPNWVANEETDFEGQRIKAGGVLLLDGPGRQKSKRKRLQPGQPINARLVAALVPKPQIVTGWALPSDAAEHKEGGSKSTHLAVPAGAVYYFEADSATAAAAIATALNWHGATAGTEIRNRRSTLLGEKGYGLGVCSTWDFLDNVRERPRN